MNALRLLLITSILYSFTSVASPICEVSPAGIQLVKSFEGLRLNAYWDVNAWAIGYGARGPGIRKGTWWTETQADVYLEADLNTTALFICKLRPNLTQHQLDAFTSLAYNIGPTKLKKSGLLTEKNNRRLAARWKMYIKSAGVPLNGLLRRRLAEIKLYNSPE
jgi:lysozyme